MLLGFTQEKEEFVEDGQMRRRIEEKALRIFKLRSMPTNSPSRSKECNNLLDRGKISENEPQMKTLMEMTMKLPSKSAKSLWKL